MVHPLEKCQDLGKKTNPSFPSAEIAFVVAAAVAVVVEVAVEGSCRRIIRQKLFFYFNSFPHSSYKTQINQIESIKSTKQANESNEDVTRAVYY